MNDQDIREEAEKYSSSLNVMGDRATYAYKAYIAAATAEREKANQLTKNIQEHIDTWSEEPSRAIRLIQKEIYAYSSTIQVKNQIKKDNENNA